MKINDTYVVKIIDQESGGRGIAKIDNLVVFIDNALTNDTCEIRITKVKKNFAEAETIKVIANSNERIENDCPFYPLCGGCDLRHQDYNSQLKFKKKKVIMAMERIGKLNNVNVLEVVPFNPYKYRNKVVLKLRNEQIGFYQKGSYNIINIDNCLISNHIINKVIKIIKKFIINNKNHNIKEILIKAEEELMINVISEELSTKFIDAITKEIHVDSIIVNNKVIYGNDTISIKLLDYTFKVSHKSFFQVNTKQSENLYKKIIYYANLKKSNVVLDLYCGVGTITTILSKYCQKVIGVEIVKDAIINAKTNAKENNINNIEFINDKVENLITKIKNNIDVIILDPPRNGSDSTTLNNIVAINPPRIIYVSCNPETLARDLKILSSEYKVIEITPFDMFPNTNHIECVVWLEKKEN